MSTPQGRPGPHPGLFHAVPEPERWSEKVADGHVTWHWRGFLLQHWRGVWILEQGDRELGSFVCFRDARRYAERLDGEERC